MSVVMSSSCTVFMPVTTVHVNVLCPYPVWLSNVSCGSFLWLVFDCTLSDLPLAVRLFVLVCQASVLVLLMHSFEGLPSLQHALSAPVGTVLHASAEHT